MVDFTAYYRSTDVGSAWAHLLIDPLNNTVQALERDALHAQSSRISFAPMNLRSHQGLWLW